MTIQFVVFYCSKKDMLLPCLYQQQASALNVTNQLTTVLFQSTQCSIYLDFLKFRLVYCIYLDIVQLYVILDHFLGQIFFGVAKEARVWQTAHFLSFLIQFFLLGGVAKEGRVWQTAHFLSFLIQLFSNPIIVFNTIFNSLEYRYLASSQFFVGFDCHCWVLLFIDKILLLLAFIVTVGFYCSLIKLLI